MELKVNNHSVNLANQKGKSVNGYKCWSGRVRLGRRLGVRQVRVYKRTSRLCAHARLNRQTNLLPNLTT